MKKYILLVMFISLSQASDIYSIIYLTGCSMCPKFYKSNMDLGAKLGFQYNSNIYFDFGIFGNSYEHPIFSESKWIERNHFGGEFLIGFNFSGNERKKLGTGFGITSFYSDWLAHQSSDGDYYKNIPKEGNFTHIGFIIEPNFKIYTKPTFFEFLFFISSPIQINIQRELHQKSDLVANKFEEENFKNIGIGIRIGIGGSFNI